MKGSLPLRRLHSAQSVQEPTCQLPQDRLAFHVFLGIPSRSPKHHRANAPLRMAVLQWGDSIYWLIQAVLPKQRWRQRRCCSEADGPHPDHSEPFDHVLGQQKANTIVVVLISWSLKCRRDNWQARQHKQNELRNGSRQLSLAFVTEGWTYCSRGGVLAPYERDTGTLLDRVC